MNFWAESNDNIYVASHRGWSEKYPENTMEAFRAAIDIGIDQIETDIRVTKDGKLVLIHDATVDRTTNGTGLVEEKTLDELKALDAGIKKGVEFEGGRIPEFVELMDYVKDHPTLTLDLELKEYPTEGREEKAFWVCDKIIEVVEEYGFADRVVINSFSGRLNEYVFQKYNGKYRQHVFYPKHHLGEITINPYSYGFCCCMFADKDGEIMASAEAMKMMAENGVEPWVGASVCDVKSVDVAIERGACLITCNNPDVILEILRKKGKHK